MQARDIGMHALNKAPKEAVNERLLVSPVGLN